MRYFRFSELLMRWVCCLSNDLHRHDDASRGRHGLDGIKNIVTLLSPHPRSWV